jgi:hypothetical protein
MNSAKCVELQYLSGFSVTYEFPTLYHRNHFVSYLLQSNYNSHLQNQWSKSSKKMSSPATRSQVHHIMLRASKRVLPLCVLPYHFSDASHNMMIASSSYLDDDNNDSGLNQTSYGDEADEMSKLEESMKKISSSSSSSGDDGGNKIELLKRINEIHLKRFDNVAKRLAVELRRMKIAVEEEGGGAEVDMSSVRAPQSKFFLFSRGFFVCSVVLAIVDVHELSSLFSALFIILSSFLECCCIYLLCRCS